MHTIRPVEIVLADLEKAECEKWLCLEKIDAINEETEHEIRGELLQYYQVKELDQEVEIEKSNLREFLSKDEFNMSDLINTLTLYSYRLKP
jgi:putative ribosome biogenesis GTPase RsgA